MDLAVRTFDFKKTVTSFGVAGITGFHEGTVISIDRSGDGFEKSRGADGTVDRINKNAYDFEVKITLKQTAQSNETLSALFAADQLSNAGVLPLTIRDLNGTTLFVAPQAWIAKDPTAELGDSLNAREWTFHTGAGVFFQGSNN